MKNVLLIISLLVMAVFGYFVMVKIDKFLGANRKAISNQKPSNDKPYVVIKDGAKDEEIKNEIENFRQNHSCACVVVCDPDEFNPDDFEELRHAQQAEKR